MSVDGNAPGLKSLGQRSHSRLGGLDHLDEQTNHRHRIQSWGQLTSAFLGQTYRRLNRWMLLSALSFLVRPAFAVDTEVNRVTTDIALAQLFGLLQEAQLVVDPRLQPLLQLPDGLSTDRSVDESHYRYGQAAMS